MDKNEVKKETIEHAAQVGYLLDRVKYELSSRAYHHDRSKLKSPEVEIFEKYTEKLKYITYGSGEYKQCLKKMKPALDHHYENNRHHPEHFDSGIAGMSLVDLVEMFCDWLAATQRHADGDIMKSISINKDRFGYDEILKSIFENTAIMLK